MTEWLMNPLRFLTLLTRVYENERDIPFNLSFDLAETKKIQLYVNKKYTFATWNFE